MDFGRNRESRSREVRSLHPGYGTAGVGILPKQRPSKYAAEKDKCTVSVHSDEAKGNGRTARIGEAGTSIPQRVVLDADGTEIARYEEQE